MRPRTAAAIGFLLGSVFGALPGIAELHSRSTIARTTGWADGVVTAREPENHDSVVIEYVVGGTKHSLRTSFVGPPNESKGVLHPGASVRVAYAADDPGLALLEDPGRAVSRAGLDILGGAFAIGAGLAVAFGRMAARARPRTRV